jgi:hypothetical protein
LFVCGLNFTAFKLWLSGAARGRTASSRRSRWSEPVSTVAPAAEPQRSSNVASSRHLASSASIVRVAEFFFRHTTSFAVATTSARTPPGLGAFA